MQLMAPPPVDELRPRYDWIRYNEPEQHLDDVVSAIAKLPGVAPRAVVAGVTYKDDSTLARLNRLGFRDTWRADIRYDLGITQPNSGIESVQAEMTAFAGRRLAAKFGRVDVLIVRHVLEHTYDTRAALSFVRELVEEGGYVVIEVPDVTRALERHDYTTLWEEHTLYFTATTLRGCLERNSYEVVALESYPYTLENSLVVIARPHAVAAKIRRATTSELTLANRFLRGFVDTRSSIRRQLFGRGRIAMLGAGHLTGAFVNQYGLAEYIDFVADDNPNKQGLSMPGSRLPILPSSELSNREIDLCLMTVRPEIEAAVVARNSAFTARGGIMASVFPDSPYSLRRLPIAAEAVA
jgi:hypothetical protein